MQRDGQPQAVLSSSGSPPSWPILSRRRGAALPPLCACRDAFPAAGGPFVSFHVQKLTAGRVLFWVQDAAGRSTLAAVVSVQGSAPPPRPTRPVVITRRCRGSPARAPAA